MKKLMTLYSQMLYTIKSVAGSLCWVKGLRSEDRLFIMTTNFIESLIAPFGAWKVGGYVGCPSLDLLKRILQSMIKYDSNLAIETLVYRYTSLLLYYKEICY